MLGTVFLRWTRGQRPIDPVLSGPGDRLAVAEDAQLEHYRRHPEHNDGDWLAEQFEVLRATDAGRLLFDPRAQPDVLGADLARRGEGAGRVLAGAATRRGCATTSPTRTGTPGSSATCTRTCPRTRKKTLRAAADPAVHRASSSWTGRSTPAIEEFGLDGLRLIDPACGSGHFLLGAFERLVAAWREQSPSLDDYELARRALDSVHGVDINPFAVAIARFRLLVAGAEGRRASRRSPRRPGSAGGRSWVHRLAAHARAAGVVRRVDEAVGTGRAGRTSTSSPTTGCCTTAPITMPLS